MFDAIIKKEGERTNWMIPFEVFREVFINDADLETARKVYEGLKPVCVYSQNEKISMQAFSA